MSDVQRFLQRDPEHFMSLREVLIRMASDGATHKEAAEALRNLLRWSPDFSDRPEWVVSGPCELWVAEDEDTRKPWKHLEGAALSGLPPTGGKAFDRFGFFAGVIIPFLAKHGIDISTDQSSTAPGPADAQEQAGALTPLASDEHERISPPHSGATEKAAATANKQEQKKTEPWITRTREYFDDIWRRELAANKRPIKADIANEVAARLKRDDKMVTGRGITITPENILRVALKEWKPPTPD